MLKSINLELEVDSVKVESVNHSRVLVSFDTSKEDVLDALDLTEDELIDRLEYESVDKLIEAYGEETFLESIGEKAAIKYFELNVKG